MTHIKVLDGGMGKTLERMGAPFRQPEWSAMALLQGPEFVRGAHQAFVDAGAEVIITNSYAVVPHHLGLDRFESDGHRLASLAGRLAREVADAAPRDVLVAGSLPPLFGSYAPQRFDSAAAPGMWQVLKEALDPWVDVWLGETIGSIAEFETLAAVLADEPRPVWASFALADSVQESLDGIEPRLRTGETLADIAASSQSRCALVSVNCSQPEVITAAIPRLAELMAGRGVALGAYANAFPIGSTDVDGYNSNEVSLGRREEITPQTYAGFVDQWIADGASVVGGCCQIFPEHIAELSRRIKG